MQLADAPGAECDHDRGRSGQLGELNDKVTRLLATTAPVSLARERLHPVAGALTPLFPDAGLVRGSVTRCQGHSAVSVALAAVAEASAGGSWLACVGLPSLGLRAASEVGIALERLVMVTRPVTADAAAGMLSALIDGFDLVVLRGADEVRASVARRVQARLQARGAALVIIGEAGHFACDVTISTTPGVWEGLGSGHGHLRRRRLDLASTGRRSPRVRHTQVWLPGASGGLEAISDVDAVADTPAVAASPAGRRHTAVELSA